MNLFVTGALIVSLATILSFFFIGFPILKVIGIISTAFSIFTFSTFQERSFWIREADIIILVLLWPITISALIAIFLGFAAILRSGNYKDGIPSVLLNFPIVIIAAWSIAQGHWH